MKWLMKAQPEVFPAIQIASSFALSTPRVDFTTHVGPLLIAGRAADVDRVSGSRTPRILAMTYGEAGHILRIIKPRTETRGWVPRTGAKLSLLEVDVPEYGDWLSSGGVIHQIASADDEKGSGTWLAARQNIGVTIFRPLYGRLHNPRNPANGYSETLTYSKINPNPVAVLTIKRTMSTGHSDFAFNPWYARQFAVVDTKGTWSIWDFDQKHGKASSQSLTESKRGNIKDGYLPDPESKVPNIGHADGWHRVLWVCNVNIIVVCNRQHLVAFNVESEPIRLQSQDSLAFNSSDWILDVKRSALNASHLFLLTTSRILWIEVIPSEEQNEPESASGSARVLLSYRHFRDADDETLRLSVLKNENSMYLMNLQNFV